MTEEQRQKKREWEKNNREKLKEYRLNWIRKKAIDAIKKEKEAAESGKGAGG